MYIQRPLNVSTHAKREIRLITHKYHSQNSPYAGGYLALPLCHLFRPQSITFIVIAYKETACHYQCHCIQSSKFTSEHIIKVDILI